MHIHTSLKETMGIHRRRSKEAEWAKLDCRARYNSPLPGTMPVTGKKNVMTAIGILIDTEQRSRRRKRRAKLRDTSESVIVIPRGMVTKSIDRAQAGKITSGVIAEVRYADAKGIVNADLALRTASVVVGVDLVPVCLACMVTIGHGSDLAGMVAQ